MSTFKKYCGRDRRLRYEVQNENGRINTENTCSYSVKKQLSYCLYRKSLKTEQVVRNSCFLRLVTKLDVLL